MPDRPDSSNLFFRLVVVAGGAFVVTVLALVAVPFGDPAAPVARWLDRYGGRLIAAEVGLILLLGFLALFIDRWQSLSRLRKERSRRGDLERRRGNKGVEGSTIEHQR